MPRPRSSPVSWWRSVVDAPLRIAVFTYSTRPRGGVVHALQLAEALAELGHHVRLFALEKPGRSGFFRPTEVPSSFIPVDERPDEGMDERIARYIEAYVGHLEHELSAGQGYDVYHAEDCISANALIRLRGLGLVPHVVRTVHHVDDFPSPALLNCQRDSIVHPDTVLVVSEWWRQRLAEDFGVVAAVVHNGVDLRHFTPSKDMTAREVDRTRLGLSGRTVVLAVGGVEPRKNSLVLLAAFVQARSRIQKATGRSPLLVIVGGASLFNYQEYRDAFEHEAARLVDAGQLEPDSVVRTGAIENNELLAYYRAADVLAFPSVKEGWGLTVLEAQATGTPVVASDLPVMREYLVHERNALLVSPEDPNAIAAALVRAVSDPALADTLRQNGLETARRYDWPSSAIRHVQIYRSILR
jgi:glycosyltransferase-like protein